jgi:PAS domain S-box-containing protein
LISENEFLTYPLQLNQLFTQIYSDDFLMPLTDIKDLQEKKYQFLSGGGEMGMLTRTKDWSNTSVGNPDLWPQSLRTIIGIVLNSKFPMFLWWGPELICFYNDAYRPSLGQNGKHPGILGMPAEQAWPEIWDIIKPLINQVLNGGEATWSEDQLIPIFRNGKMEDVYWTFSYSPVNDESGKVGGVLVTCNETTDKVLTYNKLEESKTQLEFAIDAARLGTWDYDPFTNKFTCNNRLKEWFGLPPEKEIELQYAIDAIAEKDRQRIINTIEKALDFSSGGSYEEEYSIIHPVTKKETIVYAKGKALFNEQKIAYRFNGTLEQVTEQVNARKKIETSDKRFRDTVKQAPVGITILRGSSYMVEMANDAYLQLVDRRESEFVGRPLFDSLPEAEETVRQLLDDVLSTGIPFHGIELAVPIKRLGKEEISYFNFVYHPLKEEDGTISGIMVTVTDVNETVRAKHFLAESEKQLRNIVINSPVAMAILRGKDYVVEVANKTILETMWKKREEEVAGKKIFDIFPELKGQKYAMLLDEVYTTGNIHAESEAVIELYTNGVPNKFYADVQYAPLTEADNTISGIMITANDVTTQVKARQTIEESEQRLRSFVESAPFPIGVYTGKEMRIQLVNQSIIDVWGKGNDVIGKLYAEVLPELKESGIYEQLDSVYTSGVPFHAHNQRVDLLINGRIEAHYFNYSFTPVFNGSGNIYGVMNTAAEVTDLTIAKQKVEKSEKEFRELADHLPELVWTTDKDGLQTFASIRWKEFTGLDPYDAATFEKMIHPDDLQNLLTIWSNCLAKGDIYRAQVRLKSKEGHYDWFYVHGEPVRDSEGKIEKWIGAFTNFNEQKKIEEELVAALLQIEQSEKRFRNVANSAPVLIWMAHTDTMRYFFNTAWQDFTGRKLEQEMGNGWAEAVHPEDLKKYLDHYLTAFEKQEQFYTEYRLKRHDGEYRWVAAKGVPHFSVEGVFEGFIGACMDIHERVIYQKKLKEDEERLNIIINASELGTWEFNLITSEVQYSDRYLQIFGYDEWVELSHEQLVSHLHPDDLLVRKEAFDRAFETGILQYESRLIWKDQSLHWFEGKGKVFYGENNQPVRLVGTIRDITEEKYFRQELLAREKKFRLLADSMPEFVWTGEPEGNLNYFNQSVYNYSGLTPEQMEAGGWLQIVHPEDREENIRLWTNSIKTGKDFIFEHRFRRYDGNYRWQLSRATPQRDADGNIQMWVGTSTDIQDMKEQDQQKDLFISMASHELKTPVTSIKGYVQILQSMYEGSKDKFLKTSLATVDKQIVTLTNLISELLDLSKIKSGSLVLNSQSFAIDQLIKETVKEIKHINPGYNISFSGNKKNMIDADRGRIGQVLINFLNNAIKYSPDSKEIKVTSIVKDGSVLVSVYDSGIGIEKQDQAKIFQRFYRVEGRNENTFPGFGIGLFIASEIVRRHAGIIGVNSEPGKGSVFYFSIPLNDKTNAG